MEAGVSDHVWTIEEVVGLLEVKEPHKETYDANATSNGNGWRGAGDVKRHALPV